MSVQRKLAHLASLTILASAVLASAAASADDLPCVQQAIDFNKPGRPNEVHFSAVALHTNGRAAYATGMLYNYKCSAAPWGIGTADCMQSFTVNALLSDDTYSGPGFQAPHHPFNASNPLPLRITAIPQNGGGQVHMWQPHATYDFYPECVGDLITGNDQWGNHWTISFQLYHGPH
jgi:hypothetical protein